MTKINQEVTNYFYRIVISLLPIYLLEGGYQDWHPYFYWFWGYLFAILTLKRLQIIVSYYDSNGDYFLAQLLEHFINNDYKFNYLSDECNSECSECSYEEWTSDATETIIVPTFEEFEKEYNETNEYNTPPNTPNNLFKKSHKCRPRINTNLNELNSYSPPSPIKKTELNIPTVSNFFPLVREKKERSKSPNASYSESTKNFLGFFKDKELVKPEENLDDELD